MTEDYECPFCGDSRDGKDLDDSDYDIVEELCSIGLMKTGMSFKRHQITAKTSRTGLLLIDDNRLSSIGREIIKLIIGVLTGSLSIYFLLSGSMILAMVFVLIGIIGWELLEHLLINE